MAKLGKTLVASNYHLVCSQDGYLAMEVLNERDSIVVKLA
jgi:hypothetical protein